jgi:hypothetical protein
MWQTLVLQLKFGNNFMRVLSKVKRTKGTAKDPYRVIPIPPKSVVRLGRGTGRIFRVGYYARRDGLDCIWLVNDKGEYEQTIDHDFLLKRCDIIVVSEETDLYGKHRPKLPPIRKATPMDRR